MTTGLGASGDVGGDVISGQRTERPGRIFETPTLELSSAFCSFGVVKLEGELRGHAVRLGDQASGAYVLGEHRRRLPSMLPT
jgi:hypothetical protein